MADKVLFQFPGQGSQAVGMGGALAQAFPAARVVFDEVNDALGEDLFALMQEGPEEDLRLTRNAQPALFAASMAAVAVLRDATGKPVEAMAAVDITRTLSNEYALIGEVRLTVQLEERRAPEWNHKEPMTLTLLPPVAESVLLRNEDAVCHLGL